MGKTRPSRRTQRQFSAQGREMDSVPWCARAQKLAWPSRTQAENKLSDPNAIQPRAGTRLIAYRCRGHWHIGHQKIGPTPPRPAPLTQETYAGRTRAEIAAALGLDRKERR